MLVTQPRAMALGDVNGDGRVDAAFSSLASQVFVHLGNGIGGWSDILDFPANSSAMDIAMGDVDGDGRRDLVVGSEGAFYSYLLGDGRGRFGRRT